MNGSLGKNIKNNKFRRYIPLLSILLFSLFSFSTSGKANVLIKYRYSLLADNEGKKLVMNLQPSDTENSFHEYTPYNKNEPRYIETRILASHEAIKFLVGSVLLAAGALAGTIIAIHSSSTSTKCGGDVCTSEGPSPDWLLFGIISGGVLGTSAGVTSSGYLLHEDGNFFITLAGSIVLPSLLVFISDPSLSHIPPWAIEASFPAMLVGAMAAYDLSRTRSNKKEVNLSYYPIVSIDRDTNYNLAFAVDVLEMSF